jgi:hypothetical protein
VNRYWSLAFAVAVCLATAAFAQAQDPVRRQQNQAVRQAVQEQNARRAAQDRAVQEQARQAAQDQAERRVLPDQPGSQNVPNQGARQGAQQNQNNRAQQLIIDVYLQNFRREIDLSEDQWLKVGQPIRNFIQTRFRVANQRAQLNQRLMELVSQANPSETEVRQLKEDLAQLELTASRAQNNLLNRLSADLSPKLSPLQEVKVIAFNTTFFEEQLPRLLERVREEVAARGQAPQQQRPNANKNKAPATDSFRER